MLPPTPRLVAALLATALAFFVSQTASGRDARVVVDGQAYHVEVSGTSGPSIVFEAGLGTDSTTWKSIAGPVGTFARVVLYDRAGLGRSAPVARTNAPITAAEAVKSLHAVLAAADIRPPYLLVGHSLGGLYLQMFARTYPTEVSGIVLVDSAAADAPAELKTLARLEPGTVAYREEQGMADSNRQVTASGSFPAVPLTVIAATDHGTHFRRWEPTLMWLQQQLATLSPQGSLVVAEGCGDDVQTDCPDIVVEAIRRMVKTATIR